LFSICPNLKKQIAKLVHFGAPLFLLKSQSATFEETLTKKWFFLAFRFIPSNWFMRAGPCPNRP